MQKTNFMSSMILISSITVEMGSIAMQSSDQLKLEIDKLSALKKPTKEEKSLLKESKKELISFEKIGESTKSIFDNVEKSVKALFMSDNKTVYKTHKYKDALAVRYISMPTSFEDRVGAVQSKSLFLTIELEKHVGMKVFHDNGSVWKKTKADIKRFTVINDELSSLS